MLNLTPKSKTRNSLSPEEYYSLGKSPARQREYIKNTVLVANQLLNSIEKDVKESKDAVLSKDHYIQLLENENAALKSQIIQYKSQFKEINAQLSEKTQEIAEITLRYQTEMEELTQMCESEMNRVLQQTQEREAVFQRNQNAAFHADYRIHDLEKALEDSEKTKGMLNHELQNMIEERQQWIEKLESSDRFCSMIATAHQELNLRCEYLQQRVNILTNENHSSSNNNNNNNGQQQQQFQQQQFQSQQQNVRDFGRRSLNGNQSMRAPPPPPKYK